MTNNAKKLYTIIPSDIDEKILTFKKYEDGKLVESYGLLDCEFNTISHDAEKEGYVFAPDIHYLKEKLAFYQDAVNELQSQIDKAIASGNYISEED